MTNPTIALKLRFGKVAVEITEGTRPDTYVAKVTGADFPSYQTTARFGVAALKHSLATDRRIFASPMRVEGDEFVSLTVEAAKCCVGGEQPDGFACPTHTSAVAIDLTEQSFVA